MPSYVGTLAPGSFGNWEICKKSRLWGTPKASANAEKAAESVSPGEILFVWRGGGVPSKGGLFARAEIVGQAVRPTQVPWPEPDKYGYIFPIRITDELGVAIGDRFPGNRESLIFGVANMWVNWGFWHLPEDVTMRMNAAFHRRC